MDALALLARVLLVAALLVGVLLVLRRTQGHGRAQRRGGTLQVRTSARVGKGATVAVVRLDGRELLLGVTDHTVTLLADTPVVDDEPPAAPDDTHAPASEPARAAVPQDLPGALVWLWRRLAPRRTPAQDLSREAVAAALAMATGRTPVLVPRPRAATESTDATVTR